MPVMNEHLAKPLDSGQLIQRSAHGHHHVAYGLKAGVIGLTGQLIEKLKLYASRKQV